MKKYILPDWDCCNLNITATFAEFLGCYNKNKTLPILKNELKNNYKNIVFICFDGMGIYPLNKNLNKRWHFTAPFTANCDYVPKLGAMRS